MRSSFGVLSLVSRWNRARYKRGERNGNLNKTHFFRFGVLSRFLGSSLVHRWSFVRCIYIRYKGKRILRNSIFTQKKTASAVFLCVNMLFVNIRFPYTLYIYIGQKTKVKECDGTHSEYCARRVPTLRIKRDA